MRAALAADLAEQAVLMKQRHEEEHQAKQDAAAATIQAGFRGMRARRHTSDLRDMKEMEAWDDDDTLGATPPAAESTPTRGTRAGVVGHDPSLDVDPTELDACAFTRGCDTARKTTLHATLCQPVVSCMFL